MTTTANAFRRDFPEFADNTAYPEPVVDLWLALAAQMLNVSRWGGEDSVVYKMGRYLFTAHNLVLERMAQMASAQTGVPGTGVGVLNNKSVDKVSAGYDVTVGIEEGAGHWNLTTYGTRFIYMAKMIGAGPVQVGANPGCIDPLSSINAWPGPYTGPGFSNFS